MRRSDRAVKMFFEGKTRITCDEAGMGEAILKARKAYYEAEEERLLSKAEFLYQQSRYIRKRWWLIQGALLTVLWLLLKYLGSSCYTQRSIGIAAPLFVLLIIPEMWKNKNADAMEVECSTLYSIRQVYAARMLLFAFVDLALLSLFFIAAAYIDRLVIGELVIQYFVPFNVACCICFRMLYSKRADSQIMALLLCVVWTVIWIELALNEAIYEVISVPVWIALLSLSLLYLGYSIRKGQKQFTQNEEVKALWN